MFTIAILGGALTCRAGNALLWSVISCTLSFIGTHFHSILKVLCRGLCLEENFNFSLIAEQSPGYVGADLMALVTEAALLAVNRYERCCNSSLIQSQLCVHSIQISTTRNVVQLLLLYT